MGTPTTLPGYEFISVPLWLITTLHIVTLALHFAAVGFLFGGLVVLLGGRIEDRWHNATVRQYVTLLPTAMAATITLGVAPLLFTQLVYHRQIYAAAIIGAWFWLLILVLAAVAYYLLYGASFMASASPLAKWLFPAALALLGISFIYSSVFSLAERPDAMKALYAATQSGWGLNPHLGDYLLRWLNMIAGAVAVGGLSFALLARNDEAAFRAGRTFFLGGVIGGIGIGVCRVALLGPELDPFLHSVAFGASMAGAMLALGALFLFTRQKLPLSALLLFLSIVSLVSARHAMRVVRLGETPSPAVTNVQPQWGIFLVFLVCFVLALGLVAYMVRAYFCQRTNEPAGSSLQ